MPPAQPRTRAADAPIPTSSLVTRGSAPRGTFSIPAAGLRIPDSKSFLARFQARTSLRNEVPSLPEPESALPAELLDAGRHEEQEGQVNGEHPNRHANGDASGGNARLLDAPGENGVAPDDPDPNPKLESEPRPEVQPGLEQGGELNSEPRSDARLDVEQHGDDEADVSNMEQNHEQPPEQKKAALLDEVESNSLAPSKSPEDEADEVEDTLINVVDDEDSLLYEGRPSYPVLRFCAAGALLDQHALDSLGLPLGFIWAPFGDLRDVERVDRPAKRCGTCGSFLAKGNGGEEVLRGSRSWMCVFCGRNDNDAGEAGLQANISPQTYPELVVDTVEYSHPESAGRSPTGRGAVVLIVDENIEPEEARWVRAATAAVHASAAEKGARFALITVASGCSVARHYKQDGESLPILEMMSVARAAELSPEEKEQFFLTPPAPSSSGTSSVQEDAFQYNGAYTDSFVNSRYVPGMEGPNGPTSSSTGDEGDDSKRTRFPPDAEARRLDLAILIALELINGMANGENSRILSLVTGPPSLEEQAAHHNQRHRRERLKKQTSEDEAETQAALTKLYERIGSKAGDMRVALDFLCFGAPSGFAGPVLLGAAKRSRGGLIYSAAHSFSAASALAEAATFLSQRSTKPGVVSIRVSAPLAVARVIGPAFPTAAPNTFAVPGIDSTTGFTVILKVQSGAEKAENCPSHAVVQLASKSLEATRVVTARIPLLSTSEDYLASLDSEMSALVLGKACVVSGGALTQPIIAARSIDISARRLLRGSEALAGVVRLLFELRRGILIEKQVNADCSLVLRSFFLRAECALASLLLSPRLFTNEMSDESTGLMAEVPLEKAYVTQEAVLVLDTGFNVFVYVGEHASSAAENAISESARSVAAQRISPCQLWKLRPGPDAEYVLDAYLSPTEPAKGGSTQSSTDQGFVHYCKSLAPDSIAVRLLQST